MFKGKNVLVAGGTGFVGANLVLRLLSLGANVRATLHRKDAVIKDDRIEYIKADLQVMDDCKKAVQDMEYNAESDYEPGETVEEAEDEIGISDWIDPDTGEPGEESHRTPD